MAREIPLTKGKIAIVDDAWYPALSQFHWHYAAAPGKAGYARRRVSLANGKSKVMAMHDFILPPVAGYVVDHCNRNTLDNRYHNLRYCEPKDNTLNRAGSRSGKSIYKGVAPAKSAGTWRAVIVIHGKQKALGVFDTEEAAAWAYNVAAKEAFGEYAFLNPVSPSDALPRRSRSDAAQARGRVGIVGFKVYKDGRSGKWKLCILDKRFHNRYGKRRTFNTLEEAREFARGIRDKAGMAAPRGS